MEKGNAAIMRQLRKQRLFKFTQMRVIYTCIVLLFLGVFLLMSYAFQNSRSLLIEQETGIIAQYMNRNEMVLENLTDSMRKLSAASSTNRQVASELNQSGKVEVNSAENAERVRAVEEVLSFYRNVFFDYQLHYIISGEDGSVYSLTDGIENNHYFADNFAADVKSQAWYRDFLDGDEKSCWVAPCSYSDKGMFTDKGSSYMIFVRKILDYNTQRFLGVSFISFPVKNLNELLVPNEDSCLALFDGDSLIYSCGDAAVGEVLSGMPHSGMEDDAGSFRYQKEGREYLVYYTGVSGTDWRLINLVPLDITTQSVDRLYHVMLPIMFLLVSGAVFVCLAMYVYVNKPLNRLIQRVGQIRIAGTPVAEKDDKKRWSQAQLGIAGAEREIAKMVDYMETLSEEAIRQRELEYNLKYEMLRAQLNPHFLFNTLNVIKWSAMISGAGNVADMITSLGVLLENTMNRGEREVPLREELKIVRAWLEIKNWGLKDKIQLFEDIPEDLLDFPVIRFCLQPLVENSVLHGMEGIENGEIHIRAEKCYSGGAYWEKQVRITIQDNGIGIDNKRLSEVKSEMDSREKRRHVTGIGLSSIHELMRMKYGRDCGIWIESESGVGTSVYLIFPGEEDRDVEGDDR